MACTTSHFSRGGKWHVRPRPNMGRTWRNHTGNRRERQRSGPTFGARICTERCGMSPWTVYGSGGSPQDPAGAGVVEWYGACRELACAPRRMRPARPAVCGCVQPAYTQNCGSIVRHCRICHDHLYPVIWALVQPDPNIGHPCHNLFLITIP